MCFFVQTTVLFFKSILLLWIYCKRKWSPSYLNAKNRYLGVTDWLLQQFDGWTTRESHHETPACAKHSCQTGFKSEEIWPHNSCTRFASLASSQIPDWIPITVDRLQRTSWQGTYLHLRNEHTIKKQNIFHKIQWRACLEGSKIQAWYFRQACIRSVWASGMELLAEGN